MFFNRLLVSLLAVCGLHAGFAQGNGRVFVRLETGVSAARLSSPATTNTSDLLYNLFVAGGVNVPLSEEVSLENAICFGRTGYSFNVGGTDLLTGTPFFRSRITTLAAGAETTLLYEPQQSGYFVGGAWGPSSCSMTNGPPAPRRTKR